MYTVSSSSHLSKYLSSSLYMLNFGYIAYDTVEEASAMMLGFRVNWMLHAALFGLLVVLTLVIIRFPDVKPAQAHRILVDTDVDTDDVLALLYLLKQNRTEFDLQAITVNSNGWSDAGHAVNYLYDILFLMDRDDIAVGVGGEGGILPNGTFLPNVGGYHPIIDQGTSTASGCRYRQAIPPGKYGRLYTNTNYGIRRALLPQGGRRYVPAEQATAQQVMKDAVSAGSISVFVLGTHTNLAIFLMTNPHLKKNIEHIYVMGGAIEPGIGNLFPSDSNPYAEFNFFGDPFAAYTVLHSGIPITLIPLDATRTIPVNKNFFATLEQKQDTFEAQYSFQTLKMVRDTWPNNQFHEEYCLWDSFMVGVALSQMRNLQRSDQVHREENEFAEMEYMNISVVTSNKPYGISDGSNPLISGGSMPKFNMQKNGVHSGHVQLGLQDPFCLVKDGKGKCQDGYTHKATGPEAVSVLVATGAKPNFGIDKRMLTKEFYKSFLEVINRPNKKTAWLSNTRAAQFLPDEYERVAQKTDFGKKSKMGKPVVFDMDMSAGDFLALLYLLNVPVEVIKLKGILVSPNGWATAATIDFVYDMLHMMERDDIQVGLGNVFAVGQSYSSVTFTSLGDCSYSKSIPHGSGGYLDSDTLYGFARDLPRSPRRYKPEISGSPGLGQPTALDVWNSIVKSLHPGSKITLLTNGPLTNLAEIILSEKYTDSVIQEVYIVGGHIADENENEKGNIFTVASNEYAEFNIFLDPLAAKAVFDSKLSMTMIPWKTQKQVCSFQKILNTLQQQQLRNSHRRAPGAAFAQNLISRLWKLKQNHHSYHHMDIFLGEILGAVTLAGYGNHSQLNQTYKFRPLKIVAEGDESVIAQLHIDEQKQAKMVKILTSVNHNAFYEQFANVLSHR